MHMDFTLTKYERLLTSLADQKYRFQTFQQFISAPENKAIVLRHDVDLRPENSLTFARIQHRYGVKGVYYFRAVPESWDEKIIGEIASLGHEIGYHYECLTTCGGNVQKAMADFAHNLAALRTLAPVATICMHGSPMSKYDSKDLWKTYSYRDLGIVGEPYFDVDFNRVLYLTDTGRRWDGEKVSVRDKVSSSLRHAFRTTDDIITAADAGALPERIMFTFHPQRWTDSRALWVKELLLQQAKNYIKRAYYVK